MVITKLLYKHGDKKVTVTTDATLKMYLRLARLAPLETPLDIYAIYYMLSPTPISPLPSVQPPPTQFIEDLFKSFNADQR